jgi:hypothetical protein
LKAREAELTGTVVLLFQPGEESLGGAIDMIGEPNSTPLAGPKLEASCDAHSHDQ